MALKTFTATRPVTAGDSNFLKSWHLSAGAVALVVNLCDGTSATPLIQIQVPINTSASQAYHHPGAPFPKGCHVEVISGTLNRGCIDV
jgi:hypothetical protein